MLCRSGVQAIVLQGIVGCFPWQAMVFFTLWLQLTGFNDTTASLLVATFGAGVAGVRVKPGFLLCMGSCRGWVCRAGWVLLEAATLTEGSRDVLIGVAGGWCLWAVVQCCSRRILPVCPRCTA